MRRLICLLFIAVVASTSCSGGSDHTITATSSLKYEPSTIHVKVGDTVTFVNESDVSHTVTAYQDGVPEGGSFFSSGDYSSEEEARADPTKGMLMSDESFDVTFDTPGTYAFFCIPHEKMGMKGKIIVEEG